MGLIFKAFHSLGFAKIVPFMRDLIAGLRLYLQEVWIDPIDLSFLSCIPEEVISRSGLISESTLSDGTEKRFVER
jgi:hypothetical protein